jgi:hypothetical protein
MSIPSWERAVWWVWLAAVVMTRFAPGPWYWQP